MCNTGVLADLRIKKYPHPRPTTVGEDLNIDNSSFESHARGDFPYPPERIIIRIVSILQINENIVAKIDHNHIGNNHSSIETIVNVMGIMIIHTIQNNIKYFI